jgi:pimeloyl-ACP methyl ester carboxylesterase
LLNPRIYYSFPLNRTLSSLDQASNVNNLSSSTSVSPQNINNGKSVVAVVYTPPDSFNQDTGSNRTIKVNVSELDNSVKTVLEIPIRLYRPPAVLVHGVWMNSGTTWIQTSFAKCLANNGFYYAFADYEAHNSETFDPCDKEFGNYGIDSIRNTIDKALQDHHHFLIAASQVDIIAHSMGGLMARGFVQQLDYKKGENYMKGSIHRLITIGTPHFGGPLSRFLYDRSDYWYFFYDGKPNRCRTGKVEPKKLRTIYSDANIHIDKGAIEALIPNSIAYSHLHQTVEDSDDFNLDKDAFDDCENDLLVSITSQLGGLPQQIRQPDGEDPPNQSAIYCNTVHSGFYLKDDDSISSETNSTHIQKDVRRLLSFSDSNKFANTIGRRRTKV